MSQPTITRTAPSEAKVTEELVYAVVQRTGLSFGVVSMVLFGAQACQSALAVAAPV